MKRFSARCVAAASVAPAALTMLTATALLLTPASAPRAEPIVLVTVRLHVTDAEPASFWIKNGRCPCGDGHRLAYVEFDELEICHELHPASGSTDEPVFVINGPPPLVAEPSDWSRVKARYR